ncbi:MAG: serine/threonine-protein kinase [Myxococcota bacterium]
MRPAPPTDETLAPNDSEAPAWDVTPASDGGLRVPKRERYALRGEIARGGLGRILAAEDRELGRPVALKELLNDSPGNRARFLREIRFTARLQHPAIVPVYDAVITEDGVLRYAMKLVSGTTLAEAIAAAGSLDERLALLPHVLAVADAVAYAHARGVIHRDIKPQNILVGSFGETLLIDWGVAKDLGDAEEDAGVEADSEDAGLTRVGAIVGTPAYMSPEQARGEPADRRSDVYALGATLYHLLVGRPPFTAAAGHTIEALRTGRLPAPVETLVAEIPPDLAPIVRRAMADAPAARYASGQELRQDLQRFSTGQLVAARRYTRADLVRRWLARHRAIVGVVVLALLVVIASGGVATARVVEERNLARDAQAVAEARSDALTLAHAGRSLEPDPTESATWLAAYPPDGVDSDRLFVLAQDVVSRGVARVVARQPDVSCQTAVFAADGRAVFAVGEGSARVDAQTGEVLRGATPGQVDVVVPLGADGALLAMTAGTIARVDAAGKVTTVTTLAAAPANMVTDGAVAIVGDRVGGITRLDLATGTTRLLVSTRVRINGLALHGTSWSAASGDGSVWTGPLDGGPARARFQSATPLLQLVALSDGTLLVGDSAGVVTRIAADGPPRVLLQLAGPVRLLAVGNDDRLLVAADGNGTLRAVDLDSGITTAPPWPEALVLGVDVAPQDGIVAANLEDGTLHAWRPATGEVQTRRGRSKVAGPVAFSPDGASLVTCAMDSSVRIWPTPSLRGAVHRGHTGPIFHPIFLPDGRVATDSDDQTVRIWPAATSEARVLQGHSDRVYGLEASPDGRHLLSASNDGLAIVWDTTTGESHVLRGHDGRVRRAIFTADGQRVLTGGRDGTLRSWSLDGTPLRVAPAHPGGVHWLTLDDDGGSVWTVGKDRALRRWDPDTGALDTVATGLGLEGGPMQRTFALPGQRILTCTDEHTVVIVSADGQLQTFAAADEVQCPSIQLSPDRRLAVVPVGPKPWLLDLETGEWRALAGLPDTIHAVAWSPDGRLLALAGLDGTARVLRISDGAVGIVARSEGGILGVAFSPDGRRLAAGGIDHLLWVGAIDEAALLPRDPTALRARIAGLTHAKFDDAGL